MFSLEHTVHTHGTVGQGHQRITVLGGKLLESITIHYGKNRYVAGENLLVGDADVADGRLAGIHAEVKLVGAGVYKRLVAAHIVNPVELLLILIHDLGGELDFERLGVVHLGNEALGHTVCAEAYMFSLPSLVFDLEENVVVDVLVLRILERR